MECWYPVPERVQFVECYFSPIDQGSYGGSKGGQFEAGCTREYIRSIGGLLFRRAHQSFAPCREESLHNFRSWFNEFGMSCI
jgi:hypothetical protein